MLPNRVFLRSTVMELLSDCITSRMITRSDQRRGTSRRTYEGLRSSLVRNCSQRPRRVPPSVRIVFSSPMALLPLP